MKDKILHYFRHDRSYKTGMQLIMEYSNSMSIKKQLNVQPQNDYLLGIIHEELRMLAGIQQHELFNILKKPVVSEKDKKEVKTVGISSHISKNTGKKVMVKKTSGKKADSRKPITTKPATQNSGPSKSDTKKPITSGKKVEKPKK